MRIDSESNICLVAWKVDAKVESNIGRAQLLQIMDNKLMV